MIRTTAALAIAACLFAACCEARADDSAETVGVLKLPVDRQVAGQLAAAAERISRGEHRLAEEILAELWQRAGSQLAGAQDEFQPVSRLIREQADRLPADRRKRLWERLELQTDDGSSGIAFELPTRAGFLAWRAAALRLRDLGQLELALAAFRQAARHPAATPAEATESLIYALDLQSKIEGGIIAEEWHELLTDEVRQRPITIAGEPTTIDAWIRSRRKLSPPITKATDQPALTPRWSRGLIHLEPVEKGWRQAADELREQGLIRLPAAKFCIIGSRIVARTPDGLVGLDAENGNVLWQIVHKAARDRLNLAGQPANPFFSGKLLAALAQQSQMNSLAGDLSHDDRTVYQVVEAGSPAEPAAVGSRYALEAVDVETGRIRWRAGGTKPAAGEEVRHVNWTANGAAEEFSVCGAPLVLGGQLFLLSTQQSDLMFQCIDRETLQVEWSCRVGHLLPDVSRASPQKYTAARLVWTGDMLACVTNCGVIAAVDPVRGQIRWINRFPVEIRAATRLDPSGTDPLAAAALHTWREARLFRSDGKLASISPESPFIHVIDEQTGKTMVRSPRSNGLTVLGINEEAIIILEPTAVRAVGLLDGRSLWRTVTGEVRGRGVLSDDRVLQPLADGSVAVLNLEDGKRLPSPVRSNVAWGDVAPLPGGWLSVDEFQVQMFGDAAEVARRTDGAQPVGFSELEHDFAALQYVSAEFGAIRSRWQNRELKPEDRGELLWRLIEAAAARWRWADVVALGLDGLSLDLQGERTMFGETTRRVRWDRAFQGAITHAVQHASDDERAELEALLAAKWEATRAAEEPFALQQLEHRWRTIPWTRGPALDAGEAIFLGIGLSSRDLWLRSAMNSRAADIGLKAAWRLREEWRSAGFDRDHVELDLMMLRRASGGSVRRRLVDHNADIQGLNQRLNRGPADVWPLSVPQVASRNPAAKDAVQTPIPIQADADGVWDRMDVTVDTLGRTLRFTGDGQRGGWTLALPKGPTPLQQYPLTYQGWGLGRWLIVRVGTLLFAVSPWNEQGEPEARLVWSLDLIGPTTQTQEQLIVERQLSSWKRAHEAFRILDPYGRDVAMVGPVRAGYFYYLRRGKLIAVDTHTGQQLWERWDVPPETIPLGDEDRVVLWSPEEKRCEVLDAADGRTLAVHNCNIAREDVWHVSGCRAWSGDRTGDVGLYCQDLSTDQRLWTRTFPPQSLPTELDDRTGAVLDPRGLVHLIDLETGTTLDEPLSADLPRAIERVIVCRDEFRWYLGVSGPVERSFEWLANQPLNGFRRPLLAGPLFAIDRSRRQIAWKRDVPGEPWPLDQPRSLPVLMQAFKQPPANGVPGMNEGVLRLMDQRTGRDVFTHRELTLVPYPSFEPLPEFQKFELRTNNSTFDVDYASQK